MARPRKLCPTYRRHKRKSGDVAFCEVEGKRFYFGTYNSPQSKVRYERFLLEWKSNGHRLPVEKDCLTIIELCDRYLQFAQTYYVYPNGKQTQELDDMIRVITWLLEHFEILPVNEFGPKCLKAIRQTLIEKNHGRTYINKSVERIRRIFKWGVSEELVEAPIYQALQSVPGLKRGRCAVREPERIRPITLKEVDAIKPFVNEQIWALIQLQLLTGTRPSELLKLRPSDIDQSDEVWQYLPSDHKTAHHGHQRIIYFGPKAQKILRPFLLRESTAYLFSPKEAVQAQRKIRSQNRTTPLSCGNKPGTNKKRKPRKNPGEFYTVDSYRRAIHNACNKAKIKRWSPNRIRHYAATEIRKKYGLDVAQVILGHASLGVTQVYAELDQKKAVRVVKEMS